MIMLSATQYDILTHIQNCSDNGAEPCVSDICVELHLSFATVSRAVRILYNHGLLTRRRDSLVDAYVYSPAESGGEYATEAPYHASRRCRTVYASCTGIAINQAPIEFLPWRR